MEVICEYNRCTGCQACKHACPFGAITICENERGFFFPVVNQQLCTNCSKCQKVCPALNSRADFNEPIKIYAGWTTDSDARHYSTSGGAAFALSKKVIEKGGVVCGCRWNLDHAEHAFAESIDELRQFQGSKYAQSNVNDCYPRVKEYLKQGRMTLFVGTGCQVAGLKSYLNKDYSNLLTVDLLCHGVPSQKALRDRINCVEKKHGKKVVEMRFRDKREDQTHTYCKYTFENGESVYQIVYQDIFSRGFDSNFLLRPNCFKCQYAQPKRISDITLADFWGYRPESIKFVDYRQGVSLLCANTEKGLQMIKSLENIIKEERDYGIAKKGNRNLNYPQIKPSNYEEFWQRYMTGESLEDLSKEYFPGIPTPPVSRPNWKSYLALLIGNKNTTRIKTFIINNRQWTYGPIKDYLKNKKITAYRQTRINQLATLPIGVKRVFYLGITEQPNLGDMAQHYCIKHWIEENYPDRELVMIESSVITDRKLSQVFFDSLKRVFGDDDIIVIQSGYCTQDLGGDHPLMHRLVCDYMSDARILMMPQTIFFQHEENRRICAENHNKARNMLFLARDFNSYEQALQMFPSIQVKAFPDIVTTLIGTMTFDNTRRGVCVCTRNDGEKYYTKEQIDDLVKRLEENGIEVKQKDTQGKSSVKAIRSRLQLFIETEIESYSHFEVTITDRYHGTIFSLCAGTPVIIIKTTDHKVTTGADWFKGVYNDYVYVAEDLDDAFKLCKVIRKKELSHKLKPYFKSKYYDKLKSIFEGI